MTPAQLKLAITVNRRAHAEIGAVWLHNSAAAGWWLDTLVAVDVALVPAGQWTAIAANGFHGTQFGCHGGQRPSGSPQRSLQRLMQGDDDVDIVHEKCVVLCRVPELKPPAVTAAICEALQRSITFRAIPEQHLTEVGPSSATTTGLVTSLLTNSRAHRQSGLRQPMQTVPTHRSSCTCCSCDTNKMTTQQQGRVLRVLFVVHAQIVQRMFCVKFPAGSTILLQNAQPAAEDCMYYLAEGQAEVVIMGTVDAHSKQGVFWKPTDAEIVDYSLPTHRLLCAYC